MRDLGANNATNNASAVHSHTQFQSGTRLMLHNNASMLEWCIKFTLSKLAEYYRVKSQDRPPVSQRWVSWQVGRGTSWRLPWHEGCHLALAPLRPPCMRPRLSPPFTNKKYSYLYPSVILRPCRHHSYQVAHQRGCRGRWESQWSGLPCCQRRCWWSQRCRSTPLKCLEQIRQAVRHTLSASRLH